MYIIDSGQDLEGTLARPSVPLSTSVTHLSWKGDTWTIKNTLYPCPFCMIKVGRTWRLLLLKIVYAFIKENRMLLAFKEIFLLTVALLLSLGFNSIASYHHLHLSLLFLGKVIDRLW